MRFADELIWVVRDRKEFGSTMCLRQNNQKNEIANDSDGKASLETGGWT